MNILKYSKDQVQHRRTKNAEERKHKQVTNKEFWKIHTMNIKQHLQYVQFVFKKNLCRNVLSVTSNQDEGSQTIKNKPER